MKIKLEAGFVTKNDGKVLIKATGVQFKDLQSFLTLVNDYAVQQVDEDDEEAPTGFRVLTEARGE